MDDLVGLGDGIREGEGLGRGVVGDAVGVGDGIEGLGLGKGVVGKRVGGLVGIGVGTQVSHLSVNK